MFSLIIQVISIALAAAFVIGTLYYGGTMFAEGTVRANASAVINQAQQIAGAATLFSANNAGATPASVAALITDNYLQSAPVPPTINEVLTIGTWAIDATNNIVELTNIDNDAVCTAIADNVGAASAAGAIASVDVNGDLTGSPYGCIDAGGSLTFQFHF